MYIPKGIQVDKTFILVLINLQIPVKLSTYPLYVGDGYTGETQNGGHYCLSGAAMTPGHPHIHLDELGCCDQNNLHWLFPKQKKYLHFSLSSIVGQFQISFWLLPCLPDAMTCSQLKNIKTVNWVYSSTESKTVKSTSLCYLNM